MLFLLLFITASTFAQTAVTGVVRDEAGPVPGVTVRIKGTTTGTVTDVNGKYTIRATEGAVLTFTSVGFESKEVTVTGAGPFNVTLGKATSGLNEVVVTSFGIKRQERALGYATTTITAKQLTEAGNTNFASALYGKAPGVKITTAPGGASSAVNVQIRGINSLNFNTQPLFVVDGVIIRNNNETPNGNGSNNDGYWSDQRIRGNGILDINPNDIESLTVLKGASATALYGSDAMSGAIVITTKKGSKTRGLGVDFNYVGTMEQVAFTPKFQNVYGPGYDRETNLAGGFTDEGWLKDPNSPSGYRPRFSAYAQFGPKMDGQMIRWWDGEYRSYSPQPNNYKDLFQKGYSSNANIAISNQTDKVNYRLSATRLDYQGIQRGSKQQKNTFNLNTSIKLTDKLSTDVVVNYVNTLTHNRPYELNRVLANFGGFLNRSERADVLLDNYKTSQGYKYVTLGNQARNPAEAFKYNMSGGDIMDFFWTQLVNSEDETENRLLTSATLNWDIVKHLKFRGRIGSDYTGRNTETMQHNEYPVAFNGSQSTGAYGTAKGQYSITYGDLLLTYANNITKDLGFSASGGYTSRNETYRDQSSSTNGGLVTENFFSLSNSYGIPNTSATRGFLKKQAFFGTASFNYKTFLFLEGTARDESSSTLAPGNNNYFYPSVNGSFVFSEAFKLPEFISYGKLRASYGVVGNSAPRYVSNVLYNQSSIQTTGGSVTQLTFDSQYGNLALKPEKKYEQEYGVEARFFKDRLGMDFTYYTNQVKNVIMSLNVAPTVGASSLYANAATLHSNGIEVGFSGTPVVGKFRWDARLNFAINHSMVNNLAPGFNELNFYNGDQNALKVVAQPNQPIGNILVYPIATDANGNKIINSDGLYTIDKTRFVNVGNIQPKIIGGVSNTFTYKNFSLDVLVDYRWGGKMVSNPMKYATGAGMYESTLQYRDEAHGGLAYYIDANDNKHLLSNGASAPNGAKVYHDGVILPGVNGNGQANNTIIDAATYYLNTYDWGENSVNEYAVFKNNYVKLREAVIGYRLPAGVSKALHVNNLRFSLVGRNLFYIYRTLKNLDPEAPIGATWYRQGIDEGSSPATRSFGFSLNANF
ncbi:SusC/RagA family TonB-linked outer membrane protein [Mucilaginibacter sp. RS28]|uniref:SusC/RagA family TonB-linked outer membrane protein n=1 Tax=Mucilaginibacter straminoryzae TaxID=2932774 RepID=A0A9X1X2Q5_9SPHI|nr:SusC/RagA family TonB-linked outer membrane protein [Mucilaginibacter straminoryzae]MCJ8209255.1 SusC/RagA family TonB-linked outer membrane protein [Mucilaginibacter straminoryzae]